MHDLIWVLGSSYHVVEYNSTTGAVIKQRTSQGYADNRLFQILTVKRSTSTNLVHVVHGHEVKLGGSMGSQTVCDPFIQLPF